MSVDMFTSLNNDILQCILYEWLKFPDICQLDIAVCNHNIRQLYYEALQSSTSPLKKDDYHPISVKQLYELIKWSKIRGIKNPLATINLNQIENDENQFEILLTSRDYFELSNDLQSFKYIKSLILCYCNSNLFYVFGSLKYLTYLEINNITIDSHDFGVIGLFLKQLTSLETISIINCSFDPILISLLSEIPTLKSLYIKGFDISGDFINELSKLTQLESLSLAYCDLNHFLDLSFLTTFFYLTELSLTSCKILLQDILSLNQLKTLVILYVYIISSNHINYENYLPLHQLESIKIFINSIDHNFIQFILQSKQLKYVIIQKCSHLQSSSFYEIKNLTNLTRLTLNNINIDQQLFDNICRLSRLEFLEVSGDSNQINKQNICLPFSKLSKRLSFLYFNDQPYIINKNTFEEISQLHNLKYLSFDWDLTKSLEDLQPLSQLKQLSNLTCINETLTNSYPKEELTIKVKEILQNSDLFINL